MFLIFCCVLEIIVILDALIKKKVTGLFAIVNNILLGMFIGIIYYQQRTAINNTLIKIGAVSIVLIPSVLLDYRVIKKQRMSNLDIGLAIYLIGCFIGFIVYKKGIF